MGRKNSGFTLIELLVVIAIIAILAAILFPIFSKARDNAKRISCVSNLKQLGLSFRAYMDDYGKCPGQDKYESGDVAYGEWLPRVYRYARNDRVFRCPSAIQNWSIDEQVPGEAAPRTFKISYSYNEYLQWQIPNDPIYHFGTDASIRDTKNTAMVADGYQHALFHDWNDIGAWDYLDGLPSGMNRIRYADGPKKVGGVDHWEIRQVRHMGPNILFYDLHVQQVNKEKFRAFDYPGSLHPTTCREYPIIFPDAQRF